LVPDDFDVPRDTRFAQFVLKPLGPEFNDADHAAWTSSIQHIQSTPGMVGRGWPPDEGFAAELNHHDLVQHAEEFEQRVAFAYTVLRPDTDDVLGCLYLDPGIRPGAVAVRSWVRADVAELDGVVRREVRDWLAQRWPFDEVVYAG
jgi:hypothetical protein